MQLYSMKVVAVGKGADDLRKQGYLVTFSENAPPELAEFSVLVEATEVHTDIRPGDYLQIEDVTHRITAVGEIANKNLKKLAHAIWQFDGLYESEKPGAIHLEQAFVPKIQVGSVLRLLRNEGEETNSE